MKWNEAPPEWITISGILAGLTFAALVLLMQSKEKFVTPAFFSFLFPKVDYSQVLITGLALDSVFFIFVTFCVSLTPNSIRLTFLFATGLGLLLLIIPGIIAPFSVIGAPLVALTEGCLWYFCFLKAPSSWLK